MSDELLSHKINLIQDQIDNLERSGFFTEKEMDQATASLKMQLAILKEAKAFADFKKSLHQANEGFLMMQIRANNIFVTDPQHIR
jgi:hypothetical protein